MFIRVKGEGVFFDKFEFRFFGMLYLEVDFVGGFDRDFLVC